MRNVSTLSLSATDEMNVLQDDPADEADSLNFRAYLHACESTRQADAGARERFHISTVPAT
jgi:hypothetical protein